jgi:hypothetical protein
MLAAFCAFDNVFMFSGCFGLVGVVLNLKKHFGELAKGIAKLFRFASGFSMQSCNVIPVVIDKPNAGRSPLGIA